MATIIVETGEGVANANSYINLANADVYFGTRLFSDVWTEASDLDKTKALIQAARTLDNFIAWHGVKADPDNTMQWPQVGVYDYEVVDGVVTEVEIVDIVPTEVVTAQCELAIYLLGGDRMALADTSGFSELTISGAISFKVDKASNAKVIPVNVWQLVSKFGRKKGINLTVTRA